MYDVDLPHKLKLALIPVCMGVAMATVNDFSFNALGAFWAVAGNSRGSNRRRRTPLPPSAARE